VHLLEDFHSFERFGRPRAEAIERELRLVPGFHVDEELVSSKPVQTKLGVHSLLELTLLVRAAGMLD
jgi:hypothetical protein